MKRVLSVLLVLCLLIGAVPVFASAAEASGTLATGLTWSFQNGTLTISGNGPMPDFEGSSHYEGVDAWGVPWNEQDLNFSAKSLVIEEGVTHIGNYAFTFMTLDPANIKIASSVTSIGNGSFAGCMFSDSLVLPNTIKSLGGSAFSHVVAPSITIPDGIKELPGSLFSNSFGLEKVYIPATITHVKYNTFFDEVRDVYFAGTKAQWNQIQTLDYDGNPSSDDFKKFIPGVVVHCSDGSITMPTLIGEGDTWGGDTYGAIHWSVYDDGTLEFIGTQELPDYGNGLCPDGPWSNIYPEWSGMENHGMSAPEYPVGVDYRPQIKRAIIGEGITSIGHETFAKCFSLESAVLPTSLKSIAVAAFASDYFAEDMVVKDIYYNGTKEQWEKIRIYNANYVGFEDRYEVPDPPTINELFKGVRIHFKNGGSDIPSTPSFTDVPANQYYAKPVAWAVAQGITNGKGGATTFKPGDNCTRAEIVTFLWRAMGKEQAGSEANFTDMPSIGDFRKAISWAVENGVTRGKGGSKTFMPNDTCTRAEAVTFIWRAMDKPEAAATNKFADMPSTADFQKAISWAVENGITTGKGRNEKGEPLFQPNGTCSRGEIVTFLYRIWN